MKQIVPLVVLLFCLLKYEVYSIRLPGPRVYVVTPSPRTPQNGRPVPFYYRNWIKRMDTPEDTTSTTTTTTTPKTKTPDLIFAEFESDNNNVKSIRKLLQKESVDTSTTTTTTSRPIYVPDEESDENEPNYGLPVATTTEKPKKTDMTDYFALYNNLYNTGPLHSPVYVPPSSSSSSPPTSAAPPTTTTMQIPINNVENIWHIIDSEKNDQNAGMWEEEAISTEPSTTITETESQDDIATNEGNSEGGGGINENFALPGFSTNPGNGAENESRAIRTESNFRFPYVNLKPFQMKSSKNPLLNSFSSSKKGQNMFTGLDNFHDLKNPVRGEAQDVVVPMRQPIDRYNPAQPYLPQQPYGPKPKQSSPTNSLPLPPPPPPSTPARAVANLVPPPPPAPVLTANDFPTPSTYESFPPYAPAAPAPNPLAPSRPVSMYQPPTDSGPDSTDDSAPESPPDDSDGPSMDLGYRYKPPTPPVSQFYPTVPPPSKPFSGYSYNKPTVSEDSPPPIMDMGSKPDFQGYHYSRPEPSAPSQDHTPDSYGHLDAPPPSYQPDYPELIFNKPYGGMGGMKGGNDMKDSMGMKPPPAPPADDMKPDIDPHTGPGDDSGFPHDFPGDFKFHNDFDDHDYHHHHHTTTTTSTTEMPRVNRYSYYYLGKKLYYLPLYFSVYFIIYVGALIIKAVLRHKITYPNSWKPNDQTASFFSKRSIESHLSKDNLHEITGRVTRAIASAAEKYINDKNKEQ